MFFFCALFSMEFNGTETFECGGTFSCDVALKRSFFRALFVPPPPTAVTFELITQMHTSAHKHTDTLLFLSRYLDTARQ